ncbi:DMT family transporter [Paenibacillus sacheonensis]|uniref:Ligand-binding protein SH3 n=1 Tax=Paenibacillus sacheonensis TaxID=742054 RepID=A0A7X4YUY4_9BACL|nr:multidrug efflux SMR transporter [Paenibacillus sacheonensis]MBM7566570.1 quaternary ammonium compound-resistance protein SugE [Paenibacillus sacheonensis]NBC73070.1 ligand-binding protein SH3 [Paenibacillus sacheonensis]
MAWLYLLIAGFLEVAWAYGLQESEGFTRWLPSLITIALLAVSFVFFAKAMKRVEIGTAYAVFTGIGTVGTVIVGIVVLDEPVNILKLLFIAMLVGGIVGLKVISGRDEAEGSSQSPQAVPSAQTVQSTKSSVD